MKISLSTFNFRLFLVKYLGPFLLITITILALGVRLFETSVILGSEINGAYKVNRILNGNDLNEIAILGSSRAQGSYIPDSLDNRCFNYGIDGTGMNVHLGFLENLLKRPSKAPIIFNIDKEVFTRSNGDIGNYLYNSGQMDRLSGVDLELEFIRQVPGVKYYGFFEEYLKYYLNQRYKLTKAVNKGGSFELNDFDPKEFQRSVSKRLKTRFVFIRDSELQTKFENLLSRSGDRIIFLVVAPYHESYNKSYYGEKTFLNYFTSLQKKYQNVKFINLADMPLKDVHFFNTTHLTLEGARLFSKELARLLLLEQRM